VEECVGLFVCLLDRGRQVKGEVRFIELKKWGEKKKQPSVTSKHKGLQSVIKGNECTS
jgi:hypothetical protein